MHKIIFKNSETGTPEDWTQYLSDMSSISRRVESENAGEAGVIVYDNVSLEFEYKEGSPIYTAFNGDLSSIQRYIIEVYGIKTTGEEVKVFEGLVDFSSLEWPDLSKKISFDVLDKLSALDIIAAESSRVENILNSRILSQLPTAQYLRCQFLPDPYTFPSDCTELLIYAKDGNADTLDFTDKIILPGEYLQDPQTWGDEPKYYLVKESYLELNDNNNMVNRVILAYPLSAEHDYVPQVAVYFSSNNYYSLSKEFYGIDINVINGNILEALDALKIIEAIFRKAWSTTPIINKSGSSTFSIPSEYGKRLIDENPFSKHPLDALKMLADSMQCYIFVNRLGELVIQKKGIALGNNGTTQSINNFKKKDGRKKYFWNKLADEIEITVNSWVIDEESGEYLQGASSLKKNPNIKPRNSIGKEVLAIDSSTNTQELLDAEAVTTANEYFNFYGNRHFAYPIELNLYDDILDWELLDNINIDTVLYFFESLNIDLLGMRVDLELVSVNSYNYDSKQAHVILGEGNEASYSSSSSSSSSSSPGSTVVLNDKLTALSQMDNNPGLVVQISDSAFAKRLVVGTENQVNVTNGDGVSGDITISLPQDIHTAAAPTFAGTKLTSLTANRIVSANADNELVSANLSNWITGTNNQVSIADDEDGTVTISLPQDIHTAATPTFAGAVLNGDVSVDGNLSLSSLTQNKLVSANQNTELVSANLSNWIAGTNNQVSVTDDLDGTVTLSLPQDIHTAAEPTFAKLGLGGDALSGYSVSLYADAIGTNNYVSEATGWKVGYDGSADFRSIYADEMRVKAFTVDIEQALAGSDILAKSVAILSNNFIVPPVTFTSTLRVDDLPGFNDVANFVSGDWIRLRIFDRSGGGLTVGDVWGTVSDYVNNSDDTQSWTFTTINASYPNLIGQKVYKGSIILDYGVSGQGIIERTVLGDYAPYSQMTTWITDPMSADNYTVNLRSGNLAGITDSDFGGELSGYGMYATNVYMKGKLYALSGSNVAGWETTAVQFKSPTIQLDDTNVFATAYMSAYSGANSSIGFHIGLNNTSNSNDEWISIGSVLDKDGVVEDDVFGIAYKSYNGTYFELTNTARNIAGWNFDTEKFTKGEARLEASASMSGLVISKLGTDFVRVGDFNYSSLVYSIQNMTDTYIGYSGIDYFNDVAGSPSFNDETKWNTGAWITSEDEGFVGSNNTISIYGSLDGQTHQIMRTSRDRTYWWNYTLQRRLSYSGGSEPLHKLMGHRSRINYKLIFSDHNEQGQIDGGALSVFIRYYNISDEVVQHISLLDITIPDTVYPGVYVVDKTGSNALEIDFPYNSDAEYAVLFLNFSGGSQGTTEYAPLLMAIQEFGVYGYDQYHTALNVDGLEIYNSPINYFKFGKDRAELYATDLKVAGLRPTRFHGVSSSIPEDNVQVGDISIINETTYICYALDVFGKALWKQISASSVDGAYGINELNNTAIANPALGQTLKFDGTNWVNTSATGGAGSGDDADLLDGQHGAYYLDFDNATNKPSPTIVLSGDATGQITLNQLSGGALSVEVVNDSHTHDTQYSLLNHNHDTAYSVLSHSHDDLYFTEAEITTNYYDKTYIDNNFTTTTNQYGKWVLTDGNTSFDVLKDNSVTVDGADGVTININPTTKYLTIGILGNTYAPYSHNHHDLYFTEAEILTNYYDKTYVDANFITSANQYSKWILTDGINSRDVVKDDTITLTGNDGVTTSLVGSTMNIGIAVNTYADYGHNHDADYLGINAMATTAARWANSVTFTFGEDVTGSVVFDGSSDATVNLTVLDDSHIHDGRYYTETEADALFISNAGGTFTGNVTIGSGDDTVDRHIKVITGDNNIASLYAVGNYIGHGNVFVGGSLDYGGGMFFKGASTIPEPFTVDSVSFYRKYNTSLSEVFYYSVLTEGIHFQEEIYAKGITSAIATGTAPFTIASTTLVNNLNADLWDGNEFADYLNQGVRTSDNVIFNNGVFDGSLKSASLEPTNLTTGYIPYKTEGIFIDSPIFISGTNVRVLDGAITLDNNQNLNWGNGSVSINGSDSTNLLKFYTSNEIRMEVSANGNLLLGTSADTGQRFQVEGDSYFSDSISLSTSASILNNYTSGITGSGYSLSKDLFEINNVVVRNFFRAHIFQKDIVKAVSGQAIISDSGVITYANGATIKFKDNKSSTFSIDDELWFKDIKDDGTITSVKFAIASVGSSVNGETDYTVNVTEGVLLNDMIGGTASRTSGGIIVLDASSNYSPYIDILRDGVLVSRFGNLEGVTSTSWGQLSNDGIWTSRLYAEDDVFIKGHLEATSGTIGGFTSDATKIYSDTDIVIDSFYKRITLANGAMGFGYDIGGANKHGLYIDGNNYWYSSNLFRIGGINGIDYDGTSVTIGSDTKVRGTVTGGDMVVAADGSIKSANYAEGEDGWKLSSDGFENNDMRQFGLAEDIKAGTPIKITYDGATSRVSKLKESNLCELNDNEIYQDELNYNVTETLKGGYDIRQANPMYVHLNEKQWVSIDGVVVDGTRKFGLLVFTTNEEGELISHIENLFDIYEYTYNSVTYEVRTSGYGQHIKISDTEILMVFSFKFEDNYEDHYIYKFAVATVGTDGVVTMGEVSDVVKTIGYGSVGYNLHYGLFPFGESIDSTHALIYESDILLIKRNGGGSFTVTIEAGGFRLESGYRTSDNKWVVMDRMFQRFRIYTIDGDTLSYSETAMTRTDFTYTSKMVRIKADQFIFSFIKDLDSNTGIYVISYSAGTLYQGNGVSTKINNVSDTPSIVSDNTLLIRGHILKITGNTPFYLFKLANFTQFLMLNRAGSSGNIVNFEETGTLVKGNTMRVANVISASGNDVYPTFIKTPHNKILRLINGSNDTASDFVHLHSEQFALVRHENIGGNDYLMFTIVNRDEEGYSFYANDLIVASTGVGTFSKIQKISNTHFLVKNGSYIYLIKLVETTLSLVDTYYNTSITNYNQEFAELIKSSKYVFMGASKAILLDIDGDNLTCTSYTTSTSTLIANIVGIEENQWVGAYPKNSGGYKATYRIYTLVDNTVTYTDLINTTLVDSTKKIYLAPLRGNIILSMAILSTGNGIISIEEIYSTGAATQDSREYPDNLFPSVDGLQHLNSEGYGGMLGNNIIHITIIGSKINTRFATNVVNSSNTIDNKSITAASNGDMLLYVKGDFVEDSASGGQDAIVIDVINDSFYVDGIMEQSGNEGEMKKVAMVGDETRVFSNLIPGTRYGLNFDNPEEIVEDYDKELILAVETDIAIVL